MHRIGSLLWKAIALLGIMFVFLMHEHMATVRIEPPSVNCGLAELAKKVPPPQRLAIVSRNGVKRLVWVGQIPFLTLRSGPPCYIFDDQGHLVDWCPETGEGWQLEHLKIAAFNEQPISFDEALHWCEARQKREPGK